MDYQIRTMTVADYNDVYKLWKSINGLGIRSIDDSKEGIIRFLHRNPTTSIVAVCKEEIIGTILCGHDGRRGSLYHVCVSPQWRKHGVGQGMVQSVIATLKEEKINKINLVAFCNNDIGNAFWKENGWSIRSDVNYYEYNLNNENETIMNRL